MLIMSNGSKESLKNVFLEVCEELQVKVVDKEMYFKNLQREIKEYSNFDVFANLCDVIASHYDALERDTIIRVFRTMQAL